MRATLYNTLASYYTYHPMFVKLWSVHTKVDISVNYRLGMIKT